MNNQIRAMRVLSKYCAYVGVAFIAAGFLLEFVLAEPVSEWSMSHS